MNDDAHRLRLGAGCRIIDPTPYLTLLEDRFGIPAAELHERYVFFVGGNKYLYSLSAEHRLPPGPEVAFNGIKFMRISMKVPKLTTEASVAFGARASRNYVELDTDELRAYLAREEIFLSPSAAGACTGPGYILVRHQGITLGSAYLNPRDSEGAPEGPLLLRSWFPKHWSHVIVI